MVVGHRLERILRNHLDSLDLVCMEYDGEPEAKSDSEAESSKDKGSKNA